MNNYYTSQIYKNYKKITFCGNTEHFCTNLGKTTNFITFSELHYSGMFSVLAMATINIQIVN